MASQHISTQSVALTTFHPFNRLPIELQLEIWNHALPPIILKLGWDRNTRHPIAKTNLRAFPAVLHICTSSRSNALRTLEGAGTPLSPTIFTFNATNPFRAADHFVFSTRCDTVWTPSYFLYHGLFNRQYSSSLFPTLKHLVTERNVIFDMEPRFPSQIRNAFPALETLTILLTQQDMYITHTFSAQQSRFRYRDTFIPLLKPEVNGEIDLSVGEDLAGGFWKAIIDSDRLEIIALFDACLAQHPDWAAPVLKFRDQSQFLEGKVVEYGH